jgi:hypothetical protein
MSNTFNRRLADFKNRFSQLLGPKTQVRIEHRRRAAQTPPHNRAPPAASHLGCPPLVTGRLCRDMTS